MQETMTEEMAKWRVEGYLGGVVRPLADAICAQIMRLREYESQLELMGIDYSKAPGGSGRSDRMGEGVARLQELRGEVLDQIEAARFEVERARSLCPPSEPQRYALWLHYVQGMSWAKAARAVGYSKSHLIHFVAPAGMQELAGMVPLEHLERIPEAGEVRPRTPEKAQVAEKIAPNSTE